MSALIDDTYAEAFKSLYVEFLITAKNRKWVDHAVNAAVGNGSSSILCDCEAGMDRYVGPGGDETFETPDGRPGAIVQMHVPRFWKDRNDRLEKSALVRISQNVMTCPTASCFNLIDSEEYFHMGRKVAYFGNGYQKRIERFGRKMWWVPILGGEYIMDRRLGRSDGLMGGNLWFFGKDTDSALEAAEKGCEAIAPVDGVITTFPGGVAGSGSKAGSDYDFTIASTFEKFCPLLQDDPTVEHGLPEGVNSVMEIIMNGRDMDCIIKATQAAINASKDTEGLLMISAGNYGGRLGKSFIYLHPDKQPAA
ncbi:MAG: formylmethanofuran--tetrahydromethanopterin N-formyltransferase [Gammaproteobacteria bacterium]|jgi:formylmethanofuran--tetrahydromethanopterin N-formyltransferase|nr:formylmethanofuran--tetrahydromethanopterin N-formyltransferase [Gammaproteobacteria bacterium]